MLRRLVEGLESMHDDDKRREFLLDIGGRLDEVEKWVRETGLESMVDAHRPPTFLHGGHSRDRWVVIGINPGADAAHQKEDDFKRRSADDYAAFHWQFFELFPKLRPNGNQPWWSKLYRVMLALERGRDPGPTKVDWKRLQTESTFVVQDLLPFHGLSSKTLPREFKYGSTLWTLAKATVTGISRSAARGVLVFSRHGYEVFASYARRHFELKGESSSGLNRRKIKGYIGCIGDIPVAALKNEFVAQPTFCYDKALPQLIQELNDDNLA